MDDEVGTSSQVAGTGKEVIMFIVFVIVVLVLAGMLGSAFG